MVDVTLIESLPWRFYTEIENINNGELITHTPVARLFVEDLTDVQLHALAPLRGHDRTNPLNVAGIADPGEAMKRIAFEVPSWDISDITIRKSIAACAREKAKALLEPLANLPWIKHKGLQDSYYLDFTGLVGKERALAEKATALGMIEHKEGGIDDGDRLHLSPRGSPSMAPLQKELVDKIMQKQPPHEQDRAI